MKNNIKRIISFALMLSLLVGMMAGFSAFAAETETENVEIVSKNVYFGETLNLMYAVESTSDDVVVNVYNANHELVETIKDYTVDAEKNGTDAKVFVSKIGVPAQDIDTEFYAEAVAGNTKSATVKYSVLEYLYERLYVSEGASAEQKTMYNSLLAYADAADVVVNEDTTTNIAKYAYVRVTNGTVDGTNTAAMVMAGTALNALTTTLVPANGMKLAWTVATDSTSQVVEAIAEYTVEAGKAYTLTATEVEDEDYVEEETFVDVTTSVVIGDYAAENGWVNETAYLNVDVNSIVTAVASLDPSAQYKNTGKYYTNGSNWRFYQNEDATLTISAEGKNIVSVMIKYTVANGGALTLNGSEVVSGTAVAVNATSATFVVGNTGTATNGNVRITEIEVVYQFEAHNCDYSVATCTAPSICSVCGAKGADKLPHSYDEGKVTTEATCVAPGVKTFTCSCGDTQTESIDALGHTTEQGTCDRCGKVIGGSDKTEVKVSKSHTEIGSLAGVTAGQSTGSINGKTINLDENISIVCSKGSSTSNPCLYEESIRLYQNGATITVNAANGAKIKSIVITLATKSGGQGPISVTGGTASALSNYKYTITVNEDATEVVIKTTGTSSSTRLYVANIEIVYEV